MAEATIEEKIKETKPVMLDTKRTFIMYIRKGTMAPEPKVFEFNGDLPKAIQRAKDHCEKMNFKFCGCYPFIYDLDVQEKNREAIY